MPFFNFRGVNILLVLLCISGMGFALYLETYQHLEPCPLCIFQRVGLIIMGSFALLAVLHNPKQRWLAKLYTLLSLLGIGWSVGVAGRHVWLQHLPADQIPACGPGLNYWLEAFPINSVIQKVLRGSGECAKVDWSLFGFSLPHWALLFFVGCFILVFYQLVRRHKN